MTDTDKNFQFQKYATTSPNQGKLYFYKKQLKTVENCNQLLNKNLNICPTAGRDDKNDFIIDKNDVKQFCDLLLR